MLLAAVCLETTGAGIGEVGAEADDGDEMGMLRMRMDGRGEADDDVGLGEDDDLLAAT